MDEIEGLQVLRHRYRDRVDLGFTGTRHGMTLRQWERVERIIQGLTKMGGHHTWHDGDCIGADAQAHAVVKKIKVKFGSNKIRMLGHPSNLDEKYHANNSFDYRYPPKSPLARNKDIVEESKVMIAAPNEFDEVKRGSGTWATIRHARKLNKPMFIVWPDGSLTVEGVTNG